MRHFDNDQLGSPVHYDGNSPGDDRSVVQYRSDLMSADMWSNRLPYDGITIAVVMDGNNNGIYMLPWELRWNKQSWDPTDSSTYDIDGWMRIGGGQTLLDTSRLNENVSPGAFAVNPSGEYYHDYINGGTFGD